MTKYSRENLRKVLAKHGYTPQTMDPEWCQFAVQILTSEKLDKLKR